MTRRVLACRLDNVGDVVLTGPAIRAMAHRAHVTMLVSSTGVPAAEILPGVSDIIAFDAPWVGYDPGNFDGTAIASTVARLRSAAIDEAVIFTSFHQSGLPLALVLRLADVRRITAISEDYPGSLLDVRCRYDSDLHEVEQNVAVAAAAGFAPEPSTGLDLRVSWPLGAARRHGLPDRYVVVHPGASVAARALPVDLARAACRALEAEGHHVVVTGGRHEKDIVDEVAAGAGPAVRTLAGVLSLVELCDVLAGAGVVVCGNTGPAHLAAAVGTPVVELFAPVVDPRRWRPWGVGHRLLGEMDVPCAGCRARSCPLATQVCTSSVTAAEVAASVRSVLAERSVG